MNQALHLPAYPVTDGCIGGVTEFEHTQPWIYTSIIPICMASTHRPHSS